MKKFMVSMMLTLSMLCTLIVPALAVEGRPMTGTPLEDSEVAQSTHSHMPYTAMTRLHSYKFSGLNAGYEYIYGGAVYTASSFPTKALYYTTDLTTTGSKSTVQVGLAVLYPELDNYGVSTKTVTAMNLKDSSYAWPTLEDGKKYKVCIMNNTGGVVRGTVVWYRVDRM